MNKNLEKLEAQLREIFEEKLILLIPGNDNRRKLFSDLDAAMQHNLDKKPSGERYAPNKFIIHVPPDDLIDWRAHQDILNEMADFLFHLGLSRGYSFTQQVSIELRSSNNDLNDSFFITANFTQKKPELPDTMYMANDDQGNQKQNIPDRAFLIVGGRDNFPLEKPVINIGRHSNNDLILNEPHVSRHHAQLRAINNRYVIFDVGSTGGMLINGKRITQATLQSGDVVKIGLINLIYVQDTTSEHSTTTISVDDNSDNQESEE